MLYNHSLVDFANPRGIFFSPICFL